MDALRRVVAGVILSLLAAGDVAVCAGWKATAEARMACCHDSDSCPMDHGAASGREWSPGISQRDADRCCAASEGDPATASGPAFDAIVMLPLVPILFASDAVAANELARSIWDKPPPRGRLSRQALLSVFLI